MLAVALDKESSMLRIAHFTAWLVVCLAVVSTAADKRTHIDTLSPVKSRGPLLADHTGLVGQANCRPVGGRVQVSLRWCSQSPDLKSI